MKPQEQRNWMVGFAVGLILFTVLVFGLFVLIVTFSPW